MPNEESQRGPSLLERLDLALANRLIGAVGQQEPVACAQRVLDGVRAPQPSDPAFLAGLLRLRGLVVADDDAAAVLAGAPSRLSPLTQEHRLLRGLQECLQRLRARAADGLAPDGWFLVDLFQAMTRELPRFRNNDLRRGPPWDALLYVPYPQPDQLRFLLDHFDLERCYRDHPLVFQHLHPVRQGLRLFWRFARIAPFPDFNVVIGWLGFCAFLQAKGYPLLPTQPGDQALMARLLSGPPPTKLVQLEARLLAQLPTPDAA